MKSGKDQKQSLAIAYSVQRQARKKAMPPKMAEGGMAEAIKKEHYVEPSDMMSEDERADSVVDSIMRKRRAKKMADGGMVDLEESDGQEDYNHFDELNEEAKDFDLPSPDEHVESGSSRGSSDSEDIDDGSIVSKIRAKMKMRQGS